MVKKAEIWTLPEVYNLLHKAYGPQGWWPLPSMADTSGFDERGYHRSDFSYPKTDAQQWEIVLGAILTQNTAWKNVEKAITNLRAHDLLEKERIAKCDEKKLAALITPAGYFNQKAKRLKIVAKFFIEHPKVLQQDLLEMRKALLSVNGIGPETADSIILYAAKKPSFVIDTYTKRIMARLGHAPKDISYDKLQETFMKELPLDEKLFNEYHALLVEHAKRYCQTKPLCERCPLAKKCKKK